MNRMSCKALEPRVSALVDGELAAAERDEVEGHLARCESCRSMASGFRELRLRAGGQAVSPVAPGEWALFRERLTHRIDAPRGRIIRGQTFRRWALAAAAAAALIGLAAWILPTREEPRLESFAEWRSGPQPAEIDDETLYIKYEDF